MATWSDWKRCAAPGCLLGPIPMLVLWPESARDVFFFWAIGAALMFAFAHRNGRFLPNRPVVAWVIILFVVPATFLVTTYVLTNSARLPLHDSAFRLIMVYLSTVVAAGLLAFLQRRMGDDGRLARFLRVIEPPRRSRSEGIGA